MNLKYPKIQPTGNTISGRTEYELVEDFEFSIPMGFGEYSFKVEKGYKTDLGSVPKLLWWIISPDDPQFIVGFIIHDSLYGESNVTRFFADALLAYIGSLYGASYLKYLAIYYAVRLGGRGHFKRKQLQMKL